MSDAEGRRSVVGGAQGRSVSRVGLKQRAEREVEVGVERGCVGVGVTVVGDDKCGRGEEEVVLRLVLIAMLMLFVGAVMVDLVVGKMEGGVLVVVESTLSVDVVVEIWTVIEGEMLVADDEISGREG